MECVVTYIFAVPWSVYWYIGIKFPSTAIRTVYQPAVIGLQITMLKDFEIFNMLERTVKTEWLKSSLRRVAGYQSGSDLVRVNLTRIRQMTTDEKHLIASRRRWTRRELIIRESWIYINQLAFKHAILLNIKHRCMIVTWSTYPK